jgi:LuxR family transcriptional regulator, maltose regulon positive regulatory protein
MTNIIKHPTHPSGPIASSHAGSDRVEATAVIERASVTSLADRCISRVNSPIWEIQALVLEAIARDAVGDVVVAEQALERALDLAEPDGLLFPFLFDPAPALLERHPQLVAGHGPLVSKIRELLARTERAFARRGSEHPLDQLTDAESRVLRYLPTHLTAADIANELCVSANTVKTHMRHLYAKLGVHDRKEAVERARALDLLPSLLARPQRRKALTAPAPPSAAAALR